MGLYGSPHHLLGRAQFFFLLKKKDIVNYLIRSQLLGICIFWGLGFFSLRFRELLLKPPPPTPMSDSGLLLHPYNNLSKALRIKGKSFTPLFGSRMPLIEGHMADKAQGGRLKSSSCFTLHTCPRHRPASLISVRKTPPGEQSREQCQY